MFKQRVLFKKAGARFYSSRSFSKSRRKVLIVESSLTKEAQGCKYQVFSNKEGTTFSLPLDGGEPGWG